MGTIANCCSNEIKDDNNVTVGQTNEPMKVSPGKNRNEILSNSNLEDT